METAHRRILACAIAAVALTAGPAGASSSLRTTTSTSAGIGDETNTPSVAAIASAISTFETDFSSGNFDGWTVDNKALRYGIATDGTAFGGTYDVFGTMRVNAQKGNMAAYAVVSTLNNHYLGLSRTVDLAPGLYEVGYFLGASASGRPLGPHAFSSEGNRITVNGSTLPMLNLGGIPNGNTPADFALYRSVFATAGGPTKIDLKITGSGFGEALLSIGSIYLRPLNPSGQEVPEPTTLALLGLVGAGLAARRYLRRAA